jgi:NADH-quinone oxidoreductase subunit A
MFEYYPISGVILVSLGLAVVLFTASFVGVQRNETNIKGASYECGFDPFLDTRVQFEVRFYLVAILFIIFDLEVVFLFPWALALVYLDFFGLLIMFIFLFILTVGFIYEFLKGALDWE